MHSPIPRLIYSRTPPAEPLKDQILQSVVDNLTDLSSVALGPSNPLYALYQYALGFEVHRYLDAMAEGAAELVTAHDVDAPEALLGFALLLPVKEDPQACALAFLAVAQAHRRQGIGRALVREVLARYPHTELACHPAKVPVFEALGFQVLGARGPQVLMNTFDDPLDGLPAWQDMAPIFRSVEVQQIHSYLLKQHGKRAMVDAEKQRDRHLDQLTRQALLCVQERLGA